MLGDAVPKGRARRRRQGGARADPVRALKCAPRTSKAITHFTTNRCNPSRALQTGRPLHFPNPNFAPIHITRPPKLYSGYAAIRSPLGLDLTFVPLSLGGVILLRRKSRFRPYLENGTVTTLWLGSSSRAGLAPAACRFIEKFTLPFFFNRPEGARAGGWCWGGWEGCFFLSDPRVEGLNHKD